mmetsp:Transcript_17510/g.16728  ORF Transcript_17510/g.16728 Transcript_17510/m.16728 type:complete len:239 (-) Transcript_17510:1252-1968(-)
MALMVEFFLVEFVVVLVGLLVGVLDAVPPDDSLLRSDHLALLRGLPRVLLALALLAVHAFLIRRESFFIGLGARLGLLPLPVIAVPQVPLLGLLSQHPLAQDQLTQMRKLVRLLMPHHKVLQVPTLLQHLDHLVLAYGLTPLTLLHVHVPCTLILLSLSLLLRKAPLQNLEWVVYLLVDEGLVGEVGDDLELHGDVDLVHNAPQRHQFPPLPIHHSLIVELLPLDGGAGLVFLPLEHV